MWEENEEPTASTNFCLEIMWNKSLYSTSDINIKCVAAGGFIFAVKVSSKSRRFQEINLCL